MSEYYRSVRHSIPASVALFSLLAFASTGFAQIHGAPTSVTSPGFGGRAINGAPASVTSLGPRGYAPNSGAIFSGPGNGNGHPHHHHFVPYVPPVAYAVPVPYAVDIGETDTDSVDDNSPGDRDPNYQGGPTIFDRRGSGAASYYPPVNDVNSRYASSGHSGDADGSDADPAAAEPPQAATTLIFKDGHKLEVGNYAIVGATLFDLTPGHARRIPLADLNVEATQKQNDDRGVIFQLPPPAQAN
jgi:hypothetical protein